VVSSLASTTIAKIAGSARAKCSVDDERATKPLPFVRGRDGKSTNQASRQHGIARKALRLLRGNFTDRDARGGKGVKSGNLVALPYYGHEAITDPALRVLACQLAQIAVEWFDAAREALRSW
jgi:hypothetical protein